MSKVIIFSRTFPAYHSKAGQPTYFVEKLYNSIYRDATGDWSDAIGDISSYVVELNHTIMGRKHHTIRAGSRWKAGQKFSPRVWGTDINPISGKSGPYQSKQIIIAPDIEITQAYSIVIRRESLLNWRVKINDKLISAPKITELAENDGLLHKDLLDWFNVPEGIDFCGQIICWNDKIKY